MPLNVDKISTGSLSVNGTEITPSTPPSYKVYTALLTQSGTSAPTAIVLENTFDEPIIVDRYAPGEYSFSINGGFPSNKVYIVGFGKTYNLAMFSTPLWNGSGLNGYAQVYYYEPDQTIYTVITNAIGVNTDWGTLAGTSEFPIEIRVYN